MGIPQPVALRRTRSQPARGVTTFGLQLVNQNEEVVQQGEVDTMLPVRPSSTAPSAEPERELQLGERA
jgi:hypothetical protein